MPGKAPAVWPRWVEASPAFEESADVGHNRAVRIVMLVDTSVWVDHLRRGDPGLQLLLGREEVECHPFIIGELACGSLRHRAEILSLLQRLPRVPLGSHEEVLTFIERHGLMGCGIGWIDAHLLTSTSLAGSLLWTRDRRLREIAVTLDLFAQP
ncbi:MAG TPA: type II toxin-antitoxin system VapC family toxin [Terriglobales bacterium]|nr:type II toxin-antitoxin system VapC family toxin [Terriglobales bacterium]